MSDAVMWRQVMELAQMVGLISCTFNGAAWALFSWHGPGHRAAWAVGSAAWLVCAGSYALDWVPV